MNLKTKQRIEQFRRGEVPEGYKKVNFSIIPNSWSIHTISEHLKESRIAGSKGNDAKKITVKLWNKGVVEKKEIHSGSENTQYYTRKQGQFIYSKLDFLNCAFGIVPKELDGYESTLDLPTFDIKGINEKYLLLQVIQKRFYEHWGLMAANGGRKARRISPDDFLSFPIIFPPLPEQQKIADILSTQDKVIELKEQLLAQKQQQKKYLMQQLLTSKKRLPGFNGEWKTVKLSEVVSERKQKNIQQNLRICSVAVQKGVVDQIEHLGRSYASSDTSNYSVAYYGDIIYTKSPTGNFPYGIVKQNLLQESIAVSPLYGVFSSMTFGLGYFLHTYFQSPVYARNYLLPIIQKGAKNTINITNETFISNNLYLPLDEREQNAIANIFITADREIDLLRQSIEAEKQKKKALMQLLLTGIVRVTV